MKKKGKFPPIKGGQYRFWRDSQIAEMRERGMTLQLIGDTFGITRERVRQILHGVH